MTDTHLYELCEIVRSKNAGPFILTIDAFFRSRSDFEYVRRAGLLTAARVAAAYDVPEDTIEGIYFCEAVSAVKVTMRRRVSSGAVGDEDVYGAAQHMPLMALVIPMHVEEEREQGSLEGRS